MIYRWLYGGEPQQISPLPAFYTEVRESFAAIARDGGGDFVSLAQDRALAQHLLVLAFGPQWQKDVGRLARGM
jgi:hypothetical protein